MAAYPPRTGTGTARAHARLVCAPCLQSSTTGALTTDLAFVAGDQAQRAMICRLPPLAAACTIVKLSSAIPGVLMHAGLVNTRCRTGLGDRRHAIADMCALASNGT
jgi:hypothetical protein